jgi:hypothetical protein
VVVIEQGNSATGDGTGGIGRIAQTGPALVFSLLQQLQALGLDLPAVLSQLGVDGGRLTAGKEPKAAEAKAPKQPLPVEAGQSKG